jgi:hypothetical protein
VVDRLWQISVKLARIRASFFFVSPAFLRLGLPNLAGAEM